MSLTALVPNIQWIQKKFGVEIRILNHKRASLSYGWPLLHDMETELLYKKSLGRHIWRVAPPVDPNLFVYYEETKDLVLSKSLRREGRIPNISEVRLFIKIIFEAKEISYL